MKRRSTSSIFGIIVVLSLILTGCGGGGSGSGGVSKLEDVRSATVYIVASGTFVPPQFGAEAVVGSGAGTGFIIDPSGIAITNNHVVTGAALLEVYVGGEDEPRNAKVLAVSECSDLAVIDIDGEGFPYLTWYDGEIKTGMDVYAAGYPLANPEFTLTRGIVSKENYSGDTMYSSVDSVIEHDAKINPGNSGGPLVSEDGTVVAVNYMKTSGYQEGAVSEQYFAIARDEAIPVIEKLRMGEAVTSIGVNGLAVNDGQGTSGIWVSGVKSGSMADMTGVMPGDLILSMEGLPLAMDYTMSHYCDVLRTHEPGDVLGIEVLRYNTQQLLSGQLNGRQLSSGQSFQSDQSASEPPASTSPTQAPAPTAASSSGEEDYMSYAYVVDSSNSVQLMIPSLWNQQDLGPLLDQENNTIGAQIYATANQEQFAQFQTAGILVQVLVPNMSMMEMLDAYKEIYSEDCDFQDRQPIATATNFGYKDTYYSCFGTSSAYIIMGLSPLTADTFYVGIMRMLLYEPRDVSAMDNALKSFEVIGTLPGQ